MDVDHFRSLLVENACERAEEKLLASWFPRVTAMFSGANSKAPSPFKARNTHFYKCVDVLIENQLRSLLTATIRQYQSLYEEGGNGYLPQFKLHLCLDGKNMEFFPSLAEMEATALCPVDVVASALRDVACIKVRLNYIRPWEGFGGWNKIIEVRSELLNTVTSPSIITAHCD